MDKTLEMTTDAPTNAGKHVTSNIASARSQRYTTDSVFRLAQTTLCVMTIRNFPPFVGASDVISSVLTIGYLDQWCVK